MGLPDAARDANTFFHAVDVDGNGYLEKEEVRCVLAVLWAGTAERFDVEFQRLWREWDQESNGAVDLDAFRDTQGDHREPRLLRSVTWRGNDLDLERIPTALLAWVQLQVGGPSEDQDAVPPPTEAMEKLRKRDSILNIFAKFDTNGDGTVDRIELGKLLTRLDPEIWTSTNVEYLFSSVDLDHDGRISVEEFLRWGWGDVGSDVARRLQEFEGEREAPAEEPLAPITDEESMSVAPAMPTGEDSVADPPIDESRPSEPARGSEDPPFPCEPPA